MIDNRVRITLHIHKGENILRRIRAQGLGKRQSLGNIAVDIEVSHNRLVADISIIHLAGSQLSAILILVLNRIGHLIALDSVGHHVIRVAVHSHQRIRQVIHIQIVAAAQAEALGVIPLILLVQHDIAIKFLKQIDLITQLQTVDDHLFLTVDQALVACRQRQRVSIAVIRRRLSRLRRL